MDDLTTPNIDQSQQASGEIGKPGELKPCPYCCEPIQSTAVKCPYCNETLTGRDGDSHDDDFEPPIRYPIAEPGKRLAGALLDGIAYLLAMLPGGIVMLVGVWIESANGEDQSLISTGAGLTLIGVASVLAVNVHLLSTRSQSVGKYYLQMQIFDWETHTPATLTRNFLLRTVVNSILSSLSCFGVLYYVIDNAFIFLDNHRCLHDKLAGTYVVDISQGPIRKEHRQWELES